MLAGGGVLEGVAFDPSGRLVAGGAGNGIPVWDAGTGKLVGRFGAPGETGRGAAFSPDGGAVVSGGASGKVRAWVGRPGFWASTTPPSRRSRSSQRAVGSPVSAATDG